MRRQFSAVLGSKPFPAALKRRLLPRRRRALAPAPVLIGSTLDWEVRAYNASNQRIALNMADIVSVNFEITERGGMASGSLVALFPWNTLSLSGTERVDIFVYGQLLYRGWIRVVQSEIDIPERATPTLYGLMELLRAYNVRCRYAYSTPVDLSVIFNALMSDFVTTSSRLPSAVIEGVTVGFSVQEFDAVGKSVADALNQLIDLAPNLAYWGCDVDGSRRDRIYLRPRPTQTTKRLSVGGQIVSVVYPQDISAVVNKLYISGGDAAQPNVLENASFERPQPNSETIGNFLSDYSFESGSPWNLSGGASRKVGGSGDPTAIGAARSGSTWLELDANGEQGYQEVTGIDYATEYTASIWARYEHATNSVGRTFSFWVEGRDSSGNLITTISVAAAQDPGGTSYRKYSGSVDLRSYPTVDRIRFYLKSHAGAANNDGLIFDDAAFFETYGVSNAGWTYALAGAAQRVSIEWIHKALTAYHGCYSVRAQARGIAGSSDYLEIKTASNQRVKIKGGQFYTLGFFVRGDGTNGVSFSIGVRQYGADGTVLATSEGSTVSGAYATWTLEKYDFTANSSAVEAEVFLRVRNNNLHYIDAAGLLEGGLPDDWFSGGYYEGQTYERSVAVTDLPGSVPGRTPKALTSAAQASITNYGLREQAVDIAHVTDSATAYAFAIGYFNAHAVPEVSAQLRMDALSADDLITQGGLLKLINLPNAPEALFPARINYTIDATGIHLQADLGNPRPDMVELLQFLATRR